MKAKGALLCILGILGVVFVYMYDIVLGKPINDITGPKSIVAFSLCGISIVKGFQFLRKKPK